jgi:gas vesicle protein
MKNDFGQSLIFFIAGAILGGVAVSLSTPVTGRRMRRALRSKIDDCSDRLTEAKQDLRNLGGDLLQQGEHLARSAGKAIHRIPLRVTG